jgi:alpha-beta hydrolase superfamily lysophospholipase
MRYVSDREVTKLGESLAPLLATLALPADLSPERASPPAAPVFLLHGADDAVVPASELLWLARDLGSRTRARAFATRLLSHAEVNPRAALVEMWQLAGFWQDVLVR